uniref:Phosphatidate cytidylyltransferase, mitochondrial n=1 Tax=Meloidogyne javanica TaxID=6303 RepID=A0A915LZL5_MELJA
MFPPFSKQPAPENTQNSSLNICCNDDYLDLLFGASLPLDQVCYAFAYGSGAIPQKGENQKEKMVDFILVCRLIKYGVIDTEDFEADLLDWPKLYIAGRLHKPVLNVLVWPNNQNVGQSPNRPIWQAINDNRWMAVQAALLLLPDKFSVKEFLHKIVGLSYKGDVRMGWAEDSRKIDKLVEGANEQLRMLYIPLLKNDKQISVENDEMVEQDNSIQTVFHRLQMLPYFVQRGLCNSYYPSRRFRRYNTNLDIEELIYHISHRYDVPERLDLVLQKIVGHSSKHQSIKNAFTAGISRWNIVMNRVFCNGFGILQKENNNTKFIHEMLRPHLSSNPIVNDENFIINQQQIKNCSRSPQPSILSANSDIVSPILEEQQEPRRQWICGTQVSFEWLFQRLIEKFKCPNEPEPQWIQSKLGSDLFRRECQKKWSKSCSALLLMEDLSDRARTGKITEGISAEETHCGCIGEDLAKCICWNMPTKERNETQLVKLLQYYHYQLLKRLQSFGADVDFQKEITLDRVTDAFEQ